MITKKSIAAYILIFPFLTLQCAYVKQEPNQQEALWSKNISCAGTAAEYFSVNPSPFMMHIVICPETGNVLVERGGRDYRDNPRALWVDFSSYAAEPVLSDKPFRKKNSISPRVICQEMSDGKIKRIVRIVKNKCRKDEVDSQTGIIKIVGSRDCRKACKDGKP